MSVKSCGQAMTALLPAVSEQASDSQLELFGALPPLFRAPSSLNDFQAASNPLAKLAAVGGSLPLDACSHQTVAQMTSYKVCTLFCLHLAQF